MAKRMGQMHCLARNGRKIGKKSVFFFVLSAAGFEPAVNKLKAYCFTAKLRTHTYFLFSINDLVLFMTVECFRLTLSFMKEPMAKRMRMKKGQRKVSASCLHTLRECEIILTHCFTLFSKKCSPHAYASCVSALLRDVLLKEKTCFGRHMFVFFIEKSMLQSFDSIA